MAKRLTATIDKETKQLLINDFGYEPVDLESYTGQIRALKESYNSLQISNPKDPRLIQLQIAVKDLRADREIEKDTTGTLKKTRKRRKDSKSLAASANKSYNFLSDARFCISSPLSLKRRPISSHGGNKIT